MTVYHLSFPVAGEYLNLNMRGNWRKWDGVRKVWKSSAFFYARDAINRKLIPEHLGFSVVRFSLPVKSVNIRRDPHNWFPTIKVAIDGMVQAGVWVDDSSKHLSTTEPTFHRAKDTPYVLVEIDVA